MSTVDAAIINYITNGGGSGGGGGSGVVYTAGDAINIANNQISVKYNTNTMEIVNGALSAKASSSGGGGGSTQILAGDGLRFDTSNTIHVNFDPATMAIENGKLKALIFSGGNVPTEDVLTRSSQYQSGTFSGNIYTVSLGYGVDGILSGNVLRLRNRSGDIDSFIIVRFGSISTSKDQNAVIFNISTNVPYTASIYQNQNSSDCYMEINCEAGSYDEYGNVDTDLGIFLNDQMSYSTLCTVVRYSSYRTSQ